MDAIREAIKKVIVEKDLTAEEAEQAMGDILAGAATPAQIGAFLAALRVKGETTPEILGCARAMRASATRVTPQSSDLVDTCGTGGDMSGTFNISTVAAFVVAGAGVRVAKHGNRSVSSACGSADMLEALGVEIALPPRLVARCIDEVGIGFLFAPKYHPAMAHAIGPRRELGVRTIFNVLGPLTNPAPVAYQVMGVFDPALTEPLASVMYRLGIRRSLVVHGHGGLDELSTTGPNRVSEMGDDGVHTRTLDPRDLGIPRAAPEDLLGGDARHNAALCRELLEGARGPKRDVVLLNAAAALFVAGAAPTLEQGMRLAEQSLDSGKAARSADNLVSLSRTLAEGGGGVILDDITAARRETIAAQQRLVPEATLRREAEACGRAPLDFAAALRRPGVAVIAEVKRRSPSAGVIREGLDVAALCTAYATGGAAAVSVLAEPRFFGGSLEDLAAARAALGDGAALPVLCKDFIVTEYQIYQARLAGADAVLLIAACLDRERLADLLALATGLGLTPLVEVHDATEMAAVLPLRPPVVGINNRDLRTFRTDLATTEALAPLARGAVALVSESGIHTADDVRRVAAAGADAVLVGEALVRSADPAATLRRFAEAVP